MNKLSPSGRNISPFVRLAAVALLVAGCSGDDGAYKQEIVKTCKGEKITVGEMEAQLKKANYPGRLGSRYILEELVAYDNAACGPIIATCNGVKRWWQVDKELHEAGFTGPLDHSEVERRIYNEAACPTPERSR